MSNVQTSAERTLHDMSHLVYTCGAIGRLKVFSFENLNAGDSLEMNVVGSMSLSPLKRGLALDSCFELFTFYVPYRHAYDVPAGVTTWVDFMKYGISNPSSILPVANYSGDYNTRFLGVRKNSSNTVPYWLFNSYKQIYNNYFKRPWDPDWNVDIDNMSDAEREFGMACNHLKTIWSAPLNPDIPSDYQQALATDESGDSVIDIMALNQAYGNLHTVQERDMFASRYRDVIEMMGGHTTIDADNRPQLLMRSKFWASGYDVDGTDQTALGQFSGRVKQTFQHKVPRWYCPEHGVVITLGLVRFPPVVNGEVPYLVGNPNIDYSLMVGDPALVGNQPPLETKMDYFVPMTTGDIKIPAGQYFRVHNNHVDEAYSDLGDFPFIDLRGAGIDNMRVSSDDYDNMFQSQQLGHWNVQCRFNDYVYRRLPTARDALMTD